MAFFYHIADSDPDEDDLRNARLADQKRVRAELRDSIDGPKTVELSKADLTRLFNALRVPRARGGNKEFAELHARLFGKPNYDMNLWPGRRR